jgi:hypothetical protein
MRLTRWRIADHYRKRRKVGQASCLSWAGETPALRSDDTGSTATLDRIPDPAEVRLESVWQEEWQKQLMTAALERVKRLPKAPAHLMSREVGRASCLPLAAQPPVPLALNRSLGRQDACPPFGGRCRQTGDCACWLAIPFDSPPGHCLASRA